MHDKLLVLIINDMVIFPNTEVRLEYDNTYDKDMVSIVDKIEDDLVLIVNPIDDSDYNITSLPKYGVLGRLKLKLNVPNGKTRVVLEGLRRVEISNYSANEDEHFFYAGYSEIDLTETKAESNYTNILIKAVENYIDKVPYMGNAIISQLSTVNSLSELCDLVASFLTLDYKRKKKYITIINPVDRCKSLIKDMNEDLKFIKLEQSIEAEVEKELSNAQKEYFLREKIKLMQQELGDTVSKDD